MLIYIKLGSTYYNQSFFNIGMVYNHLIAGNEQEIEIQLGLDGEKTLGKINRTANNNGTPRIMAPLPYVNWVQHNYSLGDQMKIEIRTPNSLIIYGKKDLK